MDVQPAISMLLLVLLMRCRWWYAGFDVDGDAGDDNVSICGHAFHTTTSLKVTAAYSRVQVRSNRKLVREQRGLLTGARHAAQLVKDRRIWGCCQGLLCIGTKRHEMNSFARR